MTVTADFQGVQAEQREPLIGWLEYEQRPIKIILNKKRPLLNHALFNLEKRTVSGRFSLSNIPKRRRKNFRAITEMHYHTSCNELALFLIGALAYRQDPGISRYITFDDFKMGLKGYLFHKTRIEKFDMTRGYKPDDTFDVEMEFLRAKKMYGTVYAQMEVRGDLRGRLLYSYTPQAL